ncbi:hypothetical protein [Bacillus solitudinis]|uniref:hypothetical protein n=1 Tax=Bacillus solitudinis TaxID=2014074 RepID=UPI0012FE72DB|nr:hypothetical protein [Bacillus solitudinis]
MTVNNNKLRTTATEDTLTKVDTEQGKQENTNSNKGATNSEKMRYDHADEIYE